MPAALAMVDEIVVIELASDIAGAVTITTADTGGVQQRRS